MYHEGAVVNTFNVEKPVVCMRFGPYGREVYFYYSWEEWRAVLSPLGWRPYFPARFPR